MPIETRNHTQLIALEPVGSDRAVVAIGFSVHNLSTISPSLDFKTQPCTLVARADEPSRNHKAGQALRRADGRERRQTLFPLATVDRVGQDLVDQPTFEGGRPLAAPCSYTSRERKRMIARLI